jgi:hypothetical protein
LVDKKKQAVNKKHEFPAIKTDETKKLTFSGKQHCRPTTLENSTEMIFIWSFFSQPGWPYEFVKKLAQTWSNPFFVKMITQLLRWEEVSPKFGPLLPFSKICPKKTIAL